MSIKRLFIVAFLAVILVSIIPSFVQAQDAAGCTQWVDMDAGGYFQCVPASNNLLETVFVNGIDADPNGTHFHQNRQYFNLGIMPNYPDNYNAYATVFYGGVRIINNTPVYPHPSVCLQTATCLMSVYLTNAIPETAGAQYSTCFANQPIFGSQGLQRQCYIPSEWRGQTLYAYTVFKHDDETSTQNNELGGRFAFASYPVLPTSTPPIGSTPTRTSTPPPNTTPTRTPTVTPTGTITPTPNPRECDFAFEGVTGVYNPKYINWGYQHADCERIPNYPVTTWHYRPNPIAPYIWSNRDVTVRLVVDGVLNIPAGSQGAISVSEFAFQDDDRTQPFDCPSQPSGGGTRSCGNVEFRAVGNNAWRGCAKPSPQNGAHMCYMSSAYSGIPLEVRITDSATEYVGIDYNITLINGSGNCPDMGGEPMLVNGNGECYITKSSVHKITEGNNAQVLDWTSPDGSYNGAEAVTLQAGWLWHFAYTGGNYHVIDHVCNYNMGNQSWGCYNMQSGAVYDSHQFGETMTAFRSYQLYPNPAMWTLTITRKLPVIPTPLTGPTPEPQVTPPQPTHYPTVVGSPQATATSFSATVTAAVPPTVANTPTNQPPAPPATGTPNDATPTPQGGGGGGTTPTPDTQPTGTAGGGTPNPNGTVVVVVTIVVTIPADPTYGGGIATVPAGATNAPQPTNVGDITPIPFPTTVIFCTPTGNGGGLVMDRPTRIAREYLRTVTPTNTAIPTTTAAALGGCMPPSDFPTGSTPAAEISLPTVVSEICYDIMQRVVADMPDVPLTDIDEGLPPQIGIPRVSLCIKSWDVQLSLLGFDIDDVASTLMSIGLFGLILGNVRRNG